MKKGFIIKIYGLLIFQVLITFAVCIFACYNKHFQYLLTFKTLLVLDWIILAGIIVLLFIKLNWFMKVPLNYFLLLTFTLAFSWNIAKQTYKYNIKNIIISFALTILTVAILSIYTFFTKRKVEYALPLIIISICLSLVAFVLFFIFRTSILFLIVNILCLVIFSIYLIYDTAIIVATRNGTLIFADAYIPAVIFLYVDVVNLFLSFLGISTK